MEVRRRTAPKGSRYRQVHGDGQHEQPPADRQRAPDRRRHPAPRVARRERAARDASRRSRAPTPSTNATVSLRAVQRQRGGDRGERRDRQRVDGRDGEEARVVRARGAARLELAHLRVAPQPDEPVQRDRRQHGRRDQLDLALVARERRARRAARRRRRPPRRRSPPSRRPSRRRRPCAGPPTTDASISNRLTAPTCMAIASPATSPAIEHAVDVLAAVSAAERKVIRRKTETIAVDGPDRQRDPQAAP